MSRRIKSKKLNEWTISEMKSIINGKYCKSSSERFGDDLCEPLLSYLSISHKIHFFNVLT
jgi:hypothetical protein